MFSEKYRSHNVVDSNASAAPLKIEERCECNDCQLEDGRKKPAAPPAPTV